ncbi:MAG: hypothetical protein R2860_01645 [Desulfobacterales bacterium]
MYGKVIPHHNLRAHHHGRPADEIYSPSHMGLMDGPPDTCGVKPSGIGPPAYLDPSDGRSFVQDLACGVNETSYTENAFWIDGRMTKNRPAWRFDFNPENFL